MMNTHFPLWVRILTVAIGMMIGGGAALILAAPLFTLDAPAYSHGKAAR